MTALASVSDVEAVSRAVPDAEVDRVLRLLEMVSATVRTYTGQIFDCVEDDEVTVWPRDGAVRLPERPVIEVTSVTQGATLIAPTGYTWGANGWLRRSYPTLSMPWHHLWTGCEPFTVVYTHGYVPGSVPDDLRWVVAEKAAEVWKANPPEGTVDPTTVLSDSETIGTYSHSVTYRDQATVASYAMLSGSAWHPGHKMILDKYRGGTFATVRVSA